MDNVLQVLLELCLTTGALVVVVSLRDVLIVIIENVCDI